MQKQKTDQKKFPSFIPNKIQQYLYLIRLDRPIGIWLLFFPSLLGLLYSINIEQNKVNFDEVAKYILILFLGSFLTRSLGCVINDIIDRNTDKKVARTKERPLASGKISLISAIFLFIILGACSLFLLFLLPPKSIFIALLSVSLIIIYPLMKYWLAIPQIWLGITFNWGFLVAFSIYGEIDIWSIIFYLALVYWTIAYDAIYALSDKQDDEKIKINSAAIFFGNEFYGLVFTIYLMVMIAIFISFLNISIMAAFLALPAFSYIFYICEKLKDKNFSNYILLFKKNINFAIFLALALGTNYIIETSF